jgi:hypothetical protein
MADVLGIILVFIGIAGFLANILAEIFIIRGLKGLRRDLKKNLFFIIPSSFFAVSGVAIGIYFIVIKLDIMSSKWTIMLGMYAISAIIFMTGCSKLIKFVKIIQNETPKKQRYKRA